MRLKSLPSGGAPPAAQPTSGINPKVGLPNDQFPAPWSVESTEGGHLVVRDADGIALAYVYVRQVGSVNTNGLSSNQALAIAESIARIAD